MGNLFEKTDKAIIDFLINGPHEGEEKSLIKPKHLKEYSLEDQKKRYEHLENLVHSIFKSEYDEYVKNGIYFFGCPFSVYSQTFDERKNHFLSHFEDYELFDFIQNEFDQGLFSFDRGFMDPEMTKKIEVSLRKRFYFLKNKAEEAGYELKIIDIKNVQLIYKYQEVSNEIQEEIDEGADLTGANLPKRLLYLHELGVIDFLKESTPFKNVPYTLSRALSPILNVKPINLNRYILPLHSNNANQERNPLKHKSTLEQVKHDLYEIGFKRN